MHQNPSIRVVSFVDILGWKSAFDTIGHEGLVEIATQIYKHKASFSPKQKQKIIALENQLKKQYGITQNNSKYHDISFSFVSDCFVISASLNNLDNLFNVTKWACMTLLGDHGLLTRGGITMGKFTHDMAKDIAVGKPLNDAVAIEHTTKMPRIVVESKVLALAKQLSNYDQVLYDDGECSILNIANVSVDWLTEAQNQIDKALGSSLGTYEKCKWKYIAEHLPRMRKNIGT